MLVWVLAWLASAAATAAPPPAASRYIARAWGTADGLPQNTVTSMVQTRDGYRWLGTFGGLVRFDGQAFTVFDPDNTPGLAAAHCGSAEPTGNGLKNFRERMDAAAGPVEVASTPGKGTRLVFRTPL